MITTTHTASVLVAHRQAELRSQARSVRIVRDARTARRQSTTTAAVTDAAWSIGALVRRFGLASRRPALA